MSSGAELVERVREICLALPGTDEKLSHGAQSFFVQRHYLALRADGHHRDPRPQIWCAAPRGVQTEVVADDPERFFVPPYVGGRGWIGVYLDGDVDWDEIAAIATEAHQTVTG